MSDTNSNGNFIELTAEIVSAYVSNNTVPAGDIPALINQVHAALSARVGQAGDGSSEPLKPAISVKNSITPEHIVCLEDGKKFKSLKRHLRTQYNMTPEQYREKWGLQRLSDGRAELCGRPLATRQADGPRPAAPAKREVTAEGRHRRARPGDLAWGRSALLSEMAGTRPAMTLRVCAPDDLSGHAAEAVWIQFIRAVITGLVPVISLRGAVPS